jgi:hypothetical protein
VAGYWALCELHPGDRGREMLKRFSSARSVIFIAIVSESGDSSVRSDI